MKFRHITAGAILVLVLVLVAAHLPAQDASGVWINKQHNLTMTLKSDGTYAFQGPYGATAGRWGSQGNVFWMQDQTGQVVYYTVTLYDATRLHLIDANGVPLHYARQAPAPPSAQPVQPATSPAPPAASSSGRVLLESGGRRMTADHIDTAVGVIQFIIGQEITAAEKTELLESAKKEFPIDPAEWLRQVDGLKQALVRLRQIQDPVMIGMGRQMLIAEYYKVTRNLKPQDIPLLLQVVYRYVRVMAFDEANMLALTDKDIEAMIAYMEFNNQMSGVPRTFSRAEREAFSRELVAKFPGLPLEQKQFLCSANFVWKLVEANYRQFSAAQQAQFQTGYSQAQAGHYRTDADSAAFSRMSVEEQRAYLQRKARENMANQNMFTMMNNVSTQTHATMLNTIENFGGTGNYWEVVNPNW